MGEGWEEPGSSVGEEVPLETPLSVDGDATVETLSVRWSEVAPASAPVTALVVGSKGWCRVSTSSVRVQALAQSNPATHTRASLTVTTVTPRQPTR